MIKAIVAVGLNKDGDWVIGKSDTNSQPFYDKNDLEEFKRLTSHQTVLMGQTTFDAIIGHRGKLLPNRHHIVVTHLFEELINDLDFITKWRESSIETNSELELLGDLQLVQNGNFDCWIIGGASIYKQMLPYISEFYIHFIDGEYEGDVLFPKEELNKYMTELASTRFGTFTQTVFTKYSSL